MSGCRRPFHLCSFIDSYCLSRQRTTCLQQLGPARRGSSTSGSDRAHRAAERPRQGSGNARASGRRALTVQRLVCCFFSLATYMVVGMCFTAVFAMGSAIPSPAQAHGLKAQPGPSPFKSILCGPGPPRPV